MNTWLGFVKKAGQKLNALARVSLYMNTDKQRTAMKTFIK